MSWYSNNAFFSSFKEQVKVFPMFSGTFNWGVYNSNACYSDHNFFYLFLTGTLSHTHHVSHLQESTSGSPHLDYLWINLLLLDILVGCSIHRETSKSTSIYIVQAKVIKCKADY